MNAKHTPGPLFVREPEKFPFDIEIVDAKGEVVFLESRHAHSTKQKTVKDAMHAHGFPLEQQAEMIAANERQLADARLRAAAPELLEVAISNAEYRAARDHEFGRGYNAAKNGQLRDVQKESTDWYEGYDARATIAKALGEQQ